MKIFDFHYKIIILSTMSNIIKVITYIPRKIYNYTKAINTMLEAPTNIQNSASKGLTFVSKVTGATTGAAGAAKGTVDALEALACKDGVCFVVSCIGVGADTLGFITTFVPGPNLTSIVTIPISVGCKTFVWCCKRSKLPWGSC